MERQWSQKNSLRKESISGKGVRGHLEEQAVSSLNSVDNAVRLAKDKTASEVTSLLLH